MNKFFTLIALGMVCLFANTANAQVTENFNTAIPSCFLIENATVENGAVVLPNNTTSNNTEIPVHIQTPYFNITSNTVTVTFTYSFSSNINGNKSRTFTLGTVNQTGTIAYSNSLTIGTRTETMIDVRNNALTATVTATFAVQPGVRRIIITYNGDGGRSAGTFDNLTVNSNYYYASICNAAPTASANTYTGTARQPYTGNFLRDDTRDFDANGENIVLTAISTIDPTIGKVVLNADSTFTFTPAASFTGGAVNFTYTITDNGYMPMYTTANVSITYPPVSEVVILPIHFTSFAGNANDSKAQLTWSVVSNETGSHFEVEKSTDGKKYQSVATVMTSSQVGAEKYNFADAAFQVAGSFYRIKVINKDHSTSYSKTVFIKGTAAIDNKITVMQNPVQSALNFSFNAAADETAEVAIYNLAGVKMHSQKVAARKGANSISLDMDSKYIKGAYILTVQSATATKSIQLIKQ